MDLAWEPFTQVKMFKIKLNELELYPDFKITKHRIGSTQYKQTDFSPMLSTVSIKHDSDRRFREIQDFFGNEASTLALKFILDKINN